MMLFVFYSLIFKHCFEHRFYQNAQVACSTLRRPLLNIRFVSSWKKKWRQTCWFASIDIFYSKISQFWSNKMKNYHNSVILRPKLPQICIDLKIRKFADSPLREKTDDIIQKHQYWQDWQLQNTKTHRVVWITLLTFLVFLSTIIVVNTFKQYKICRKNKLDEESMGAIAYPRVNIQFL